MTTDILIVYYLLLTIFPSKWKKLKGGKIDVRENQYGQSLNTGSIGNKTQNEDKQQKSQITKN